MRYPAVAGRFYPLDKGALEELVRDCFLNEYGPGEIPEQGSARRIKCALAPHAGINVSGPIAAHTFAELRKDGHRDAYIIIGPDHYGQPFDLVMCSDPYVTPMGECKVSKVAGRLAELIADSPNAHRFEHSIEVELPFLQFIDPEAEIIPIIMGRQDVNTARRLADAIRAATEGTDTVVIASSDLMHYVPDRIEKRMDSAFLSRMLSLDIDGMYEEVYSNNLSICGYGPIAAAIMATQPSKGLLLSHSNSWETIRYDQDAVVGYASAIFE